MADVQANLPSNELLKYYSPNHDEAYQRTWRLISEKIVYLLKRGPQILMTYEPLYSQIYHIVCSGKSQKMFRDLMSLVAKHLDEVNQTLGNVNDTSLEHFIRVSKALRDFIGCAKTIILLFTYFNKRYVSYELSSDLSIELGDIFHRKVLEYRMPVLMAITEEALKVPCSISPNVFHRFCQDVWTVSGHRWAVKYPGIFSRYQMSIDNELNESDAESDKPENRDFEDRVGRGFPARSNQRLQIRFCSQDLL